MIELFFHRPFEAWITYRAAVAAVLAFILALILGPSIIASLRRRRIEDQVEKGDSAALDAMMSAKKFTPTMGGIFVVLSILGAILVFGDVHSRTLWVMATALAGFAALGTADDVLKWRGRPKGGLRMFPKLAMQCVLALGVGAALTWAMLQRDPENATKLNIPFCGFVADLGAWYPLFAMLTIVSCVNAVNITDGLDGLASGCLAIAFFAYAAISYAAGRVDFSDYLNIPFMRSSSELTIACTAILGATLGFLWFNCHPAQVFMGDAGSQPLGAALAVAALVSKQEVLLVFVGGVFVIEAASSLLQMISYKLTGRRLWLCAPLHHHFQFKGMPESKIVLRLWIVAAVLAVSSLATLKLQ